MTLVLLSALLTAGFVWWAVQRARHHAAVARAREAAATALLLPAHGPAGPGQPPVDGGQVRPAAQLPRPVFVSVPVAGAKQAELPQVVIVD